MTDHFLHVPLAEITASLTNPRTSFDHAQLTELAADIQRRGVDSPILLRPLPGDRVADTDRTVKYEIVFGERRYRASQQAGVATIPARVRDMTDEQALEAQLVENLHRTDLTALEEAEGYHTLMTHANLTAEQLAERIEKSRTYVYNRLKLLDLCHEGRSALRMGQLDASKAMLIARIPDHELQLKALDEFTETDFHGDQRLSYRGALAWINANVMLRLAKAPFALDDAVLCQDCGACNTCPKRTGANPDLFADADSPDICTDPACYHGKEQALLDRDLDARRQKGQQIVDEADLDDYTELDQAIYGTGCQGRTVAELMNEHMSTAQRKKATKAGVVGGQVVNLVSADTLTELKEKAREKAGQQAAKNGTPQGTEPRSAADRAQAQQKRKLEDEYEGAWRTRAAQSLKPQLLAGAVPHFAPALLRLLLLYVYTDTSNDAAVAAFDLGSDAEIPFDISERSEFSAYIDALPDAELFPRLLTLLVMEEAHQLRSWQDDDLKPSPTTAIDHLAPACGVDLAAIKAEVQAEMREEFTPQAPPTNAPAARRNPDAQGQAPKAPARAAKTSPEEAKKGIADALQGIEGAASAPKGAVAPPAAPGRKQDVPAWPFPGTDNRTPAQKAAAQAAANAAANVKPEPTDPLYTKALKIITKTQMASVRLLKAQLGIGTTKALELMAALEAAGKVSPAAERGARKVLVTA